MADIVLHLPDGNLLHMPEGTSPEDMQAAARKYGDQQAASAQQKAEGDSGFLHQLGQTAKEFATGAFHFGQSPVEQKPITLGSLKSDPLGELGRFFSPANVGSMARDAALIGGTSKATSTAMDAMPSASAVGKGVETASRIVPKKVFGTDVPMLREGIEGFGKSLQSPERNVPGFDRHMPNTGGAEPSSLPASINGIKGVPYSGLSAGEEMPMGGLSGEDVAGLKKQGFSDELIARIAKSDKGSDAPFSDVLGPEGPSKPFDWPEVGGSFAADDSGSHVQVPRGDAQTENIAHNSPFGEGAVIPSTVLPTELRSAALDGLNAPQSGTYTTEAGYGTVIPNDFSVEAVDPNIPPSAGVEMGSNPLSKLESIQKSLGGSSDESAAPAPSSAPPSNLRTLPRGDDFWGPGARTREGLPSQAESSKANLLYDPQTPSDYLREQLSSATDPNDRAFLSNALRQRYSLHRAVSGLAGK